VEEWAFQQLLLYLKSDLQIPGQCNIRDIIVKEYNSEKEKMKTCEHPSLKVWIYKTHVDLYDLLTNQNRLV